MVARAVLDSITVEEDGTITTKQTVLDGESREDIEYFQHYGFASVPLKGAEGIDIFIGGDRDSGVTIATEDSRYRIKNMKGGEVAIYTDEGDVVHFKRGRKLEVVTGQLNAQAEVQATVAAPLVTLDAQQVNMTGNLAVTGTITAAAVAAGGIAATGPAGVSDATGTLAATREDLEELDSAYGVHIHGGVTTGPGSTTGPVAP
jgi:phage baseplate assembly protein V